MKATVIGALVVLVASAALALKGQPTVEDKWRLRAAEFEPKLKSREVFIDAGELLATMQEDAINLVVADVRSERDWNVFRLLEAEHVPLGRIDNQAPRFAKLGDSGVVVLVSNDEAAAVEAWKRLMVQGAPNAYILEGGVNRWLDIYGEPAAERQAAPGQGNDTLRHPFAVALGARHPASHPDAHHAAKREFEKKIKLLKKVTKTGGCG